MDAVDFYRVPLACEAASHIGCGIRAKPLLRNLEENPAVEGAWLHRTGALLAVVWRSSRHDSIVADALSNEQCACAKRVTDGDERRELANALLRRDGWYRAAELDQLSEEEARIIAARVVRRAEMSARFDADERERATTSISNACLRVLSSEAPGTYASREERLRKAILGAGRAQLGTEQYAALEQAMQLGNHRALADEA